MCSYDSRTRPVWYRSLYWRIAFGFVALLAVVLVLQVILFLWLTDRIVGPSSKSPQQLATNLAAEIGSGPCRRSVAGARSLPARQVRAHLSAVPGSAPGRPLWIESIRSAPARFLRARCCRGRVEAGGSGTRVAVANRGEAARADAAAEVSMAAADRRNAAPPDSRGPRPDRAGPPGRPHRRGTAPTGSMARTRAWAIVRPIRMDAAGARTAVRVGSDPRGRLGNRDGDRSGRSAAGVRRSPGDRARLWRGSRSDCSASVPS